MLWGRAAGRCEFAGCNRPLWRSPVTQEGVNLAEKAHIYAFSPRGPRGSTAIPRSALNRLQNLLLVCHDCHVTIDRTPDLLERYPAARLLQWKAEHEERVELATSVGPDKRSHVVIYGANIGDHRSPLRFEAAAESLFPDRYPAADRPIALGMTNSALGDGDPRFWEREAENLRSLFDRRIREPRADGHLGHLSVFALAPQPLLIYLGSLLVDIDAADVYQLHREPPTWRWADEEDPIKLHVREPPETDGPPALVLSLSATIDSSRIRAVDPALCIWELSIDLPHNDFLKHRSTLRAFRQAMRALLDRIKAAHGQDAELAIFPAMPIACAVELGRVRMPKADLPWIIYDQLPKRGFVPALRVPRSEISHS